jgi:hypothetical protein
VSGRDKLVCACVRYRLLPDGHVNAMQKSEGGVSDTHDVVKEGVDHEN